MFDWPKLELTDYERQWVRPYKTKDHAGVLRRTYERTIYHDPSQGGPNAQVQIARRARVLALTFSGALSTTRLQITNASGTLYNVRDARTGLFPIVSSLVGGSFAMAGSWLGQKIVPPEYAAGAAGDLNVYITTAGEHAALLIDPNWVLTPNETLIFNGSWSEGDNVPDNVRLNIAVHVWEFPGMGNADKAVREVL